MSAQKDLEGLGSYEASCRFRETAEALIVPDATIAREAEVKNTSQDSLQRERTREAGDADPGDS